MFTCKQVSNALSREDYEKLPPLRRFLLKLHVKLCVFCGRFNRQVMDSQDMCRHFKCHEQELAFQRPKMDEARKAALKDILASNSAGDETRNRSSNSLSDAQFRDNSPG